MAQIRISLYLYFYMNDLQVSLSLTLSPFVPFCLSYAKVGLSQVKVVQMPSYNKTIQSIVTCAEPVRSKSSIVVPVIIRVDSHTGHMGKTIMSFTGCCCFSSQRQCHIYPVPAKPSAQFVRPHQHTHTHTMTLAQCLHSQLTYFVV